MPLSEQEFANQDDNILFQLIKKKQWQKGSVLLPTLANSRDRYGNTPLHDALGFQAPTSFIVALLKEYPEACRVHGTDDWLPLHVAAMWGSSPHVVERLIRHYPQALDNVGCGGIKGRTPRHVSNNFPANKQLLERPTQEWLDMVHDGKRPLEEEPLKRSEHCVSNKRETPAVRTETVLSSSTRL